jgi:hypothetical protein
MKTYENHLESFRRQEMHQQEVTRFIDGTSPHQKSLSFRRKCLLDLPEDPYVVKKPSLSRWTFLLPGSALNKTFAQGVLRFDDVCIFLDAIPVII